MAEINSSKKSEGLCEKIHNAVSPFRPRIRRISVQPQGSISIAGDKNSTQTKPARVLHQSKTIPVEFRHFSAQDSKKESDEKEISIVRGQKFVKSTSKKPEPVPLPHHVHFATMASSKKDEDRNSGKFSDYISKFKNRMLKTASDVSGGSGDSSVGGGGGNSIRRDSFNDKVTSYIDRAKIKIRTTTNVGADQNNN